MEIFLSFKGLLYEIRLIGFDLCKIFEDNLEVDLVGYDETCALLILIWFSHEGYHSGNARYFKSGNIYFALLAFRVRERRNLSAE